MMYFFFIFCLLVHLHVPSFPQDLSTQLVIQAAATLSNLSGDVVGLESLVTDQVRSVGGMNKRQE